MNPRELAIAIRQQNELIGDIDSDNTRALRRVFWSVIEDRMSIEIATLSLREQYKLAYSHAHSVYNMPDFIIRVFGKIGELAVTSYCNRQSN